MKRKIRCFLCVISLMLSLCFVLSSCDTNEALSIESAQINENGELVLIYSDGTEQNLGVVVGQDGADGKDGENGKDGKNGKDGENGESGDSGSLVIVTQENGVSAASSKGLRSAVGIVCNFQANVQQGGWRPGSGSTTTKEYSSAG